MVVCKFYIQGSCKFGDRCRNEHPRSFNNGYNNQSQRGYNNYGGQQQQQQRQDQYHWQGGGGGRGNANKSVSFKDSFGGGGSNQNRFGALDPGGGGATGQKSDGQDLTPHEIIDIIKKDIEEWENGKMWPLSCYKPNRAQNCIPGFEDITQDELRFAAYCAEKQQKFEQYKAGVTSLMNTVQQQKDQLKRPTSDLSSQLLDIYKGVYQAGSNASLGNGDSMFQALMSACGGNSVQTTPVGTAQKGSTFGSATPATGSAPATSGFGTGFGSGVTGSQGATTSTGFGTGSFGSSSGGFGSAAGSETGLFGKGGSTTTGTGLFGKGASTGPPDGLFGKGAAASNVGSTSTGGLFGKGGAPPAPTGLFGKPAVPSGGGIFGQSATTVDNTLYTPLSELTADEKEQFEADSFMIGRIPMRPPPIELIR